MDKASVSGAEDCGFKSHLGQIMHLRTLSMLDLTEFYIVKKVGKQHSCRPSGLMDKASVSGAEDCGFKSHLGQIMHLRTLSMLDLTEFYIVKKVGKQHSCRPSGLMDKASVSGAEDCGFKSHLGQIMHLRTLSMLDLTEFYIVKKVGKQHSCRPSGLMDKASVSGAEDCGFKSHLGQIMHLRTLSMLDLTEFYIVKKVGKQHSCRPSGLMDKASVSGAEDCGFKSHLGQIMHLRTLSMLDLTEFYIVKKVGKQHSCRPSGLMDKASVSGAEDCGFKSHLGQIMHLRTLSMLDLTEFYIVKKVGKQHSCRPSGLMDKASVSGAEDCGFKSHLGQIMHLRTLSMLDLTEFYIVKKVGKQHSCRPSGLMDKASVSGAEDCGFKSHLGQIMHLRTLSMLDLTEFYIVKKVMPWCPVFVLELHSKGTDFIQERNVFCGS
ncbi:hypothetical protein AOLI_G00067530 [Acnodon oligacanthus]